jgi:hypothetical protein
VEGRVVQDRSRPGDAWARLGFTCVKRAIIDEGGLVYVLSDTGLWIVKISPGKQQQE